MELTRRGFVTNATVGGAALAVGAAPVLATTSLHAAEAGSEGDAETTAGGGSYDVVGTYGADVCVVGIGYSGMTAMVQALELGCSVVGIEQFGYPGGGACGAEGIFSLNSEVQAEQGYKVEPVEFVKLEMDYHHNRANGLKWMDLAKNSGDDVDWLIGHGVEFPEITRSQCFYSSDRVYSCYTPHMVSEIERLGGQCLCNTTAKELLTDESGAVTGVVAQKATGEYVQVNAPAVILACGGYARNPDLLREAGYRSAEDVQTFIPGFNGDGITMARAVGADDILYKAAALQQPTILGTPGGEYGTFGNGNAFVVASRSPNNLWVNETGERFCDENSGAENWMALIIPQLLHKKCYSVYDRAAFETNFYGGPTAYDRTTEWQYSDEESVAQFEQHFADNVDGDCVVADTIEELCEKAAAQFEEMDHDLLLATITNYNAMCEAGEDSDFGKDAEYMQAFTTPPFYMVYTPPSVMVTYGGLANDRQFRVLDKNSEPIAGLWVTGNDACDLWPNIYTINVQCGTSANHIYGGRTAAKSAAEYIGTPSGTVTTDGDCTPCVIETSYEMPDSLADGTYTSADYQGMFGVVRATVTVEGGKIVSIEPYDEMETAYVGEYAIQDIVAAVIEAQDVNVSTVGGATASSNAIRSAIEDALAQAAQ